jgi:hypothetical protein
MDRRWRLSLSCALLAAMALSPSLLFGSIEDQRARLPAAAVQDVGTDCSDPATGTWLGQQYNPRSFSWQRYELTIRRTRPGANTLVGEVRVHFWIGPYSLSTPQTDCARPFLAAEVMQNATGTINGLEIAFGGNDWRTSRVFCQPPGTRIAYNPDHFTGTIDVAIQEFQSVNNDGGTAVNEPVVFRRIRCADAAVQPSVVVLAPAESPRPANTRRPRSIFGCAR